MCWTRTGEPGFPVEYGSWHTARIELDLGLNRIRYFIDGRQLGEDRFDQSLRGARLWVSLDVHADMTPVMGFVDKVRIGSLP